jgi:hypothetical protein
MVAVSTKLKQRASSAAASASIAISSSSNTTTTTLKLLKQKKSKDVIIAPDIDDDSDSIDDDVNIITSAKASKTSIKTKSTEKITTKKPRAKKDKIDNTTKQYNADGTEKEPKKKGKYTSKGVLGKELDELLLVKYNQAIVEGAVSSKKIQVSLSSFSLHINLNEI